MSPPAVLSPPSHPQLNFFLLRVHLHVCIKSCHNLNVYVALTQPIVIRLFS